MHKLARPKGKRGLPIDQREASPRKEGHLSLRKKATMTMRRTRSMRMKKMTIRHLEVRRIRVIRNRIVQNSNSSRCLKNNRRKMPSHHHR